MENVLAAFVIIFIALFGVLSMGDALLEAQGTVQESWQDQTVRHDEQARTHITPISAFTDSSGRIMTLVLRNDGSTKLVVDDWDAFTQYDGLDTGLMEPTLRITRHPYNGVGDANQWPWMASLFPLTVAGVTDTPITSSVLNMSDADHPADQRIYTLVTIPVYGDLIMNDDLTYPLMAGEQFTQADIDAGRVKYAHSADGPTDGFQFTIADATIQSATTNHWAVAGIYADFVANLPEIYDPGILNPGEEMALRLTVAPPVISGTAAQITVTTANGVIASTMLTGTAPYTFTIAIKPYVAVNTGLIVPDGGNALLTLAQLRAEHDSALPADLVYTITVAPQYGTLYRDTTPLGVGSTFTQVDLSSDLRYEHLSGGPDDSFSFTVSDGVRTTGSYEFAITIN